VGAARGLRLGGREVRLPSLALWRELSRTRPAAVWVHEFSPYTVTALAWARSHGKIVIASTELGQDNASYFSGLVRWWHGLCGRWVDGVVACSPAARVPLSGRAVPVVDAFHAYDAGELVPVEEHQRDLAPPVIFVYLGKLEVRKGLDLWFRAAGRLKRQLGAGVGGAFRLRVIGGGDEGWAREEAERAGVGGDVEWLGFLEGEKLRERLGCAHVFVLPTRQDTYGAVVHEAACLGLPLLVSCHAGAAWALAEGGEGGMVIDPADEEGFARAMGECLDGAVRARLGEGARRRAERLSAGERGVAVAQFVRRLAAER